MNYRHQFHAGNFADVWKHALLIPLLRGMQRKEKGFLFLDTHAGRGSYDLSAAAVGETLARTPEHPAGVGRVLSAPDLAPALGDYAAKVKAFDRSRGNLGETIRFYPGSPWIADACLRRQDRMALCELHEEEFARLKTEFARHRGVSVHSLDGYTAVRAMLPPQEKRALVLIDPPYEDKDEYARIVEAVGEAVRRMPSVTVAIWYPLTQRAGTDVLLDKLLMSNPPSCFTAELRIAGEPSALKMRGCGLLVISPPWQIEAELKPVMEALTPLLEQESGGSSELRWWVREK